MTYNIKKCPCGYFCPYGKCEPREEPIQATDPVTKPSHYQGKNGLEAIEVVENFAPTTEHLQGFYWGNAMKYLLRYSKKNGLEDLKKAKQNLTWLIEALGKESRDEI